MSLAASAVVVLTADGIPLSALAAVRAADAVFAAPGVAGAEQVPDDVVARADREAVVVLVEAVTDPAAKALVDAGVAVIEQPVRPLVQAVAVMDRLRSPGGCPWDAEQTHDSLRRYLVEETYELLDAIESGDRPAMLEELGDVLLQVLFHARVAAEHPDEPFDVDDVAAELVDKLVQRHPHVFGDGEKIHTAAAQEQSWHQLKHVQKRRESIVDGVALGQPAAALAGKLAQRTAQLDLPEDLLDVDGDPLFRQTALRMRAGEEPEGALRAAAKRFAATVRAAEAAARADGADPATMGADGWRRYWSTG